MRKYILKLSIRISQYGENLIIDGIIGNKTNGFFIDVGANDPIILNNTKRFLTGAGRE
jgi:hypothetical protein